MRVAPVVVRVVEVVMTVSRPLPSEAVMIWTSVTTDVNEESVVLGSTISPSDPVDVVVDPTNVGAGVVEVSIVPEVMVGPVGSDGPVVGVVVVVVVSSPGGGGVVGLVSPVVVVVVVDGSSGGGVLVVCTVVGDCSSAVVVVDVVVGVVCSVVVVFSSTELVVGGGVAEVVPAAGVDVLSCLLATSPS